MTPSYFYCPPFLTELLCFIATWLGIRIKHCWIFPVRGLVTLAWLLLQKQYFSHNPKCVICDITENEKHIYIFHHPSYSMMTHQLTLFFITHTFKDVCGVRNNRNRIIKLINQQIYTVFLYYLQVHIPNKDRTYSYNQFWEQGHIAS